MKKHVIEYDVKNFPTTAGEIRKRLNKIPNFPFDKLEDYCLLVLKIDGRKRILEIVVPVQEKITDLRQKT